MTADPPVDMSDEVAVVTGGTRGIGRSVCRQLARRGATVVATYNSDDEAARETADELAEYDAETAVRQFDVGNYDAVADAFDGIEDEFGQVTILVNNAGTYGNGLLMRMDPDEWEQVVRTNLTGTFNCTKQVARSMVLGDGGSIVNVSSIGGLRGWAGQSGYAASKAGIIGFTQSVARELGERDIRVNAVAPGYTDTSLLEPMDSTDITDEEDIPQDRIGDADEIAECITFLASDRASYVNGEVIRADGGLLA